MTKTHSTPAQAGDQALHDAPNALTRTSPIENWTPACASVRDGYVALA